MLQRSSCTGQTVYLTWAVWQKRVADCLLPGMLQRSCIEQTFSLGCVTETCCWLPVACHVAEKLYRTDFFPWAWLCDRDMLLTVCCLPCCREAVQNSLFPWAGLCDRDMLLTDCCLACCREAVQNRLFPWARLDDRERHVAGARAKVAGQVSAASFHL